MSDENRDAHAPFDDAATTDQVIANGRERRRPTARRLAAVATGTTIALGAGGIAWAATGTPDPTPSTSSSTVDPTIPNTTPGEGVPPPDVEGSEPGWRAGGHGGPVDLGFGHGMALHGEQVVETSDGVYETIATQRGTVDALSDTELTVTSEDGFSRTYTLTADSLVDERSDETVELAVGDAVLVVATVDGTEATVTRAMNLDALPTPSDGHGFPHGGPDREQGTAPSGTPPDATPEGSST